ncbi:MAG: hypothetical protein ACRDT6_09535 [Micromonosporaceae bacterium]
MAWPTIDDGFPDHPKVAGLSDAAFRLHVSGICYSARHLTDGIIDAAMVPRLVPAFRRRTLVELVDRGMWIQVPFGDAYSIHDYLEWNRSREQVIDSRERLRAVRSEAGRKGAEARWQTA